MTYKDVIELLETTTGRVSVAVIYGDGRAEWYQVDVKEFLWTLRLMSNAAEVPFPGYVQMGDGEIYIHPGLSSK